MRSAAAATIFNLSPTTFVTDRGAGSGAGQGVSVSTSQTIGGFGFYANLPGGGNAKFMIWDATNSTLLFSTTQAIAASGSQTWIDSGPISFDLVGGSAYYFGIIADSPLDVGYITPTVPYSSNGLAALTSGNANYLGFATPSLAYYAGAEIGLQISGASAVPEPASWALMILGFIGLSLGLRRRYATG